MLNFPGTLNQESMLVRAAILFLQFLYQPLDPKLQTHPCNLPGLDYCYNSREKEISGTAPNACPVDGTRQEDCGFRGPLCRESFWELTYLQQNVQDEFGICFLRKCFLWGILGEPLLLEAPHTVGTKNLHGPSLLQHQRSQGTRYFRQCKVLSIKRMISGVVLNRILCPKPLHVPGAWKRMGESADQFELEP